MEKSSSVLESETASVEDQNRYAKWTAVQIKDELKSRGMKGKTVDETRRLGIARRRDKA